jgi:hypothetical protein
MPRWNSRLLRGNVDNRLRRTAVAHHLTGPVDIAELLGGLAGEPWHE